MECDLAHSAEVDVDVWVLASLWAAVGTLPLKKRLKHPPRGENCLKESAMALFKIAHLFRHLRPLETILAQQVFHKSR